MEVWVRSFIAVLLTVQDGHVGDNSASWLNMNLIQEHVDSWQADCQGTGVESASHLCLSLGSLSASAAVQVAVAET